ncbi:hypothetical protein PLICRDRAFT_694037 [Plicaturopsis crispa FD-325 SS-3]|nr:hypothetical protein PLICRDRAFT_694037 [Plicaturopsis crispa FD-325 SS-3]
MPGILPIATATTIGLTCKAFLNSGLCSVTVNGLSTLLDALNSDERNRGRVANHTSVLDDPVTWGVLPAHTFLRPRMTRWALGASDVMFTNPVLSAFFRNGQVLETFRGKGVYQPAVDTAIKKLNNGAWVHLFGEGKIHQPHQYPHKDGVAHLPRFKWGVGRIIMETAVPPLVIPMWLTGFDTLMPEGRRFPYNYMPRIGAKLSVTFGDPLPAESIQAAMGRTQAASDPVPSGGTPPAPMPDETRGWLGDQVVHTLAQGAGAAEKMDRIRSDVTAILHRAVEALGHRVSGDMLGCTTINEHK